MTIYQASPLVRASGIPAMGGPSAARSVQAIVSPIPASIEDEDKFGWSPLSSTSFSLSRPPLSPGEQTHFGPKQGFGRDDLSLLAYTKGPSAPPVGASLSL